MNRTELKSIENKLARAYHDIATLRDDLCDDLCRDSRNNYQKAALLLRPLLDTLDIIYSELITKNSNTSLCNKEYTI